MDRNNRIRTKPSTNIPTLQIYLRCRKCATSTTADWLTMRFNEFAVMTNKKQSIAPIKPLSPSQARIEALKMQKERAKTALDTERKRQKVDKAQKSLQNALVG